MGKKTTTTKKKTKKKTVNLTRDFMAFNNVNEKDEYSAVKGVSFS